MKKLRSQTGEGRTIQREASAGLALRLEGCRAEPGQGPGRGLGGLKLELWWSRPLGSAGTGELQLLRQTARRRNSLASPFLLSSSLLPVTSMDTREHTDEAEKRKRKEEGSEGTRPRTGSLVVGGQQILFSKKTKDPDNISGPTCSSRTMILSHQMESESPSFILRGTL